MADDGVDWCGGVDGIGSSGRWEERRVGDDLSIELVGEGGFQDVGKRVDWQWRRALGEMHASTGRVDQSSGHVEVLEDLDVLLGFVGAGSDLCCSFSQFGLSRVESFDLCSSALCVVPRFCFG
uniref:Uncharacterized protein n=1 Tax=Compsopogon caeruleus TaxID=31354 RepID=A0A6T6BH96_9RHOD|eukprot:CAMPEP_0184689864 /NCGR_PEP_ID=MMETSP0312-20130426/30895_1 /TAXON_ID=31354 /ORGANISM="Compsopogon coeruleus, Strain SAG 36.94" /LENGTH=122 /DNA_ID=CAMNT_0027147269 /DNA_START=376 /DNA_END=744 /DNA_ORIENTATION=-